MFSGLDIAKMLDLLDRPAFCVADGVILCANQAALGRQIREGTPIDRILGPATEEFDAFTGGSLYVVLDVDGISWGASVTKIGGLDVFTMDPDEDDPALRAYALAAKTLRGPLHEVMTIANDLQTGPEQSEQAARLNRGLSQLLRLVGNMSQPGSFVPNLEMRNLTAVMQEIFDRAQVLCRSAGVALHFENHPAPIYSAADSALLERSVYILLSNSVKYAGPGGVINASLKRRRNSVYLTIADSGQLDKSVGGRLFDRYRREPGVEDGRHGIGLGLRLAQTAAAVHKGTLLVDEPPTGGVRVTMSLPIRQSTNLRSPVRCVENATEWDTGLIELSEVLPPEWYRK